MCQDLFDIKTALHAGSDRTPDSMRPTSTKMSESHSKDKLILAETQQRSALEMEASKSKTAATRAVLAAQKSSSGYTKPSGQCKEIGGCLEHGDGGDGSYGTAEEHPDENEFDYEDDEEARWEAEQQKREELRGERDGLLTTIAKQLSSHEKKDVFAIGGAIPLAEDKPVVIRWGAHLAQANGRLCELPVASSTTREAAFTKLVEACQPATFGFGTKDVFDEDYRKAGKMDVEDLCLNLNLAEYSIMDTITQALVQSVWSKAEMNGVRAELYKLNVS